MLPSGTTNLHDVQLVLPRAYTDLASPCFMVSDDEINVVLVSVGSSADVLSFSAILNTNARVSGHRTVQSTSGANVSLSERLVFVPVCACCLFSGLVIFFFVIY